MDKDLLYLCDPMGNINRILVHKYVTGFNCVINTFLYYNKKVDDIEVEDLIAERKNRYLL